MQYTHVDSPVGPLLLAGEAGKLSILEFPRDGAPLAPQPGWVEDRMPFAAAIRQLAAYFDGRLQEFDLELAPAGTVFQRRVWDELRAIPFGETISYGELARRVGNPNASRAVGAANGRNPIAIVIPCHRVIGSTGGLTGFGGGLETKRFLLSLERERRQPGLLSGAR